MNYNTIKKMLLVICPILISGCSVSNNNKTINYLNRSYHLNSAGDLHGLDPTSNEVLSGNEGFTSYINLFNKNNSYFDFQCKGTSYDDFYCDMIFHVEDKYGNVLVDVKDAKCYYTGSQSGKVVVYDKSIADTVGTIYVYTPYWCRWQWEYDVDNSGNKTLLTFEFWKGVLHSLPDFLKE